MPKRKRGTPRLSRYVKGTWQSSGKGWHVGEEAKTAKAAAARSRAAAAPATTDAAARSSDEPPSQSHAPQPSKLAAAKRKRRDVQPKSTKRRALSKEVANLPRDLGSTAEGRHKAFAREGRSDASSARLAQYHTNQAAKHVKKLIFSRHALCKVPLSV